MLFRRLSKHVAEQNWVAVVIDFFIVVSGVMIGLQAQGWVENRKAKADYAHATDRLERELEENLNIIAEIEPSLIERLDQVAAGMTALQSCEDTDENISRINRALLNATGTHGLKMRSSALRELTENAELLAQQSDESRVIFANLLYQYTVLSTEAVVIENFPLKVPIENNPVIGISDLVTRERTYNQRTWISRRRPLTLIIPVSEACKDDELLKSLYYWERWQSELLAITNVLTAEINQVQSHIKSR